MNGFGLATAVWFFVMASPAFAAVTCTLDHPERDVKRLVRESTSYRMRELIPFRHGQKEIMKTIEKALNDTLDGELETPETPYTFYAPYNGVKQAGLILGTNARGVGGIIQVFVAYDRKGDVRDLYIQKMNSRDAPQFRSKYYREQYRKFGTSNVPEEADVKPPVRSPSNETIKDHHNILRAIRLNILIVKHLYNKFHE